MKGLLATILVALLLARSLNAAGKRLLKLRSYNIRRYNRTVPIQHVYAAYVYSCVCKYVRSYSAIRSPYI